MRNEPRILTAMPSAKMYKDMVVLTRVVVVLKVLRTSITAGTYMDSMSQQMDEIT
jgi:hypothetical protein